MNLVTPASSTGIVSSSGSAAAPALPAPGAGVGRRDDPAHRLGQPIGPHRLHDVVGGVDGERVDGVLVVGRDEDDLRPLDEPRDDPGQLHAVEPGHRDVGEDDVDVAAVERPQRVGAARGGEDLGDAVVLAQQPAELLERRRLVVDDERAQGCARGAAGGVLRAAVLRVAGGRASHGGEPTCVGWTPGAYLGTRNVTFVPAPGAVSTTRPKSSP